MLQHFSVIFLLGILSATPVVAGGYSDGSYGTHLSCPVSINESGTKLVVFVGQTANSFAVNKHFGSLKVESNVERPSSESSSYSISSAFQQLADQWLRDQGLPTLRELHDDPMACLALS